MNLHSSVNQAGDKVTKIIHFSNGNKRTIKGVITATIQEGSFTKFFLEDGRFVLVNTKNVDMIEVFPYTSVAEVDA